MLHHSPDNNRANNAKVVEPESLAPTSRPAKGMGSTSDLNDLSPAGHGNELTELRSPRLHIEREYPSLKTTQLSENISASRSHFLPSALRLLLTSNTFNSMFGNIVLVSHLSFGLGLQLCCAALAIYNEKRHHDKKKDREEGELSQRNDARSLLHSFLRSPGIFRFVMGFCFLTHAAEQIGFGGLTAPSVLLATSFSLLSIGSFFVGKDLHESRRGARSETRRNNSSLAPLLTSGALYWGCADTILGMHGAFQAGYTLTSLPPLFISGALCATASIVSVVALGRQTSSSAVPMVLNSFTNLSFAAANLLYVGGEVGTKTATAVGLWGIGSLCIAFGKLRKT